MSTMLIRPFALLLPILILSGCRGERDAVRPAPTPVPAEEAAASHILVAWSGSTNCPPSVTRSRDDARERARQIAVMLRTGRGEFDALARKYSDDATVARNDGYLGTFRRGEMDPLFEVTVFKLAPGDVSEPIETNYGWHVVRREEVRRARAHHILIAWREAVKAATGVTRNRAEARKVAEALRRQALAPDVDLCDLALKFSDDPHSRLDCGDLGWLEPGVLEKNVDAVLFKLAPGEVSPVVETEYGFHVFWRE
jgi:peptidyl-prolyl cis-trans isomerase SurA